MQQARPSPLQREILDVHDQNPEMDAIDVGQTCGCSAVHVRRTIAEYRKRVGAD